MKILLYFNNQELIQARLNKGHLSPKLSNQDKTIYHNILSNGIFNTLIGF